MESKADLGTRRATMLREFVKYWTLKILIGLQSAFIYVQRQIRRLPMLTMAPVWLLKRIFRGPKNSSDKIGGKVEFGY